MKKLMTIVVSALCAAVAFTTVAGEWVYDSGTKTIRDAAEGWNWKLKVAGPVPDGALTIGDMVIRL